MCLYCIYNYMVDKFNYLKNDKIFIGSAMFIFGVLVSLFLDEVIDVLINLTNND